MNNYKKIFAYNLRFYRVASDYTLEEVSDISGISTTVWSSYENERGNPTLDTLKKISDTLAVPLTYLLKKGQTSDPVEDIKLNALIRDINQLEERKKGILIKIIRLILLFAR
ncbi:helix-turn-helix transcriptional regulator [Clostridium sp. E02]|uniref:helix-turn-helix domain-containing protein n=1 Tax=Clostridium sp. E02 TaxID=2487134 RepID=UPI000F534C81|nr:helix-turn-helix transcriptional regulator [Clostridium sp. E02]